MLLFAYSPLIFKPEGFKFLVRLLLIVFLALRWCNSSDSVTHTILDSSSICQIISYSIVSYSLKKKMCIERVIICLNML